MAYVHELSGLQIKVLSPQKIRLISNSRIREQLGDNTFIARDSQDYEKE